MNSGRECEICGTVFIPRRLADKTCSLDCQIQLRRRLSRERAARYYTPRPPRPDVTCGSCQAPIATPKTGPMPRWCNACKAAREDVRARGRKAVRRCYKCQVPLPDAERKPGKAVCATCRVDPRERGRDHEQRRRLRKYGLTQEQYDQMLLEQGGRCRICRTDDPGVKGWCIDHCHRLGHVRAILCGRCNMVLGLADEDPVVLRRIADFAESLSEIKI